MHPSLSRENLILLKEKFQFLFMVTSGFVCKRKVIAPLTGMALIYVIFIKRFGFHGVEKLKVKRKTNKHEKYNDEELLVKNKESPVVSGWFSTTLLHNICTSLFGMLITSRMKKKFHMDIFKKTLIPDLPTFYPVVSAEKEFHHRKQESEQNLWEILHRRVERKEFNFVSIPDLIELYREEKIKPIDVVKEIIRAIKESENLRTPIRAFIEYYEEQIIEQAVESTRRWEQGRPLSIVDGIPVGVKDDYIVAGHHSHCGFQFDDSPLRTLDEEGGLVKKLRKGGAIILGVTNMHLFGMGVTGIDQLNSGTSRNPYNPEHCTGGSSGGSAAAVASGLCVFALGSDGGGSIRIPAASCGLVGLKGTFARYSLAGRPGGTTVTHSGALCSSLRDMALVYGYLAGADDDYEMGANQPPVFLGDFEDDDLTGIKIGVDWHWIDECNQEIREECLKVLERLEKENHAEIISIHVPEKEEIFRAHVITILSEMSVAYWKNYEERFDKLNLDVKLNLTNARAIDSHDYIQSAKQRTRSMNALKYIFKNVDVVLTPGCNEFQPVITDSIEKYGYLNNDLTGRIMQDHVLANLTGIPSICQPIGYSENNLPIAVQVMTAWWREDLLLRIGRAIEKHVTVRQPQVYFDMLKQ